MASEQLRYSPEELKEFELLLTEKLQKAKNDLSILKESINRSGGGYDTNNPSSKTIDDGADALEREQLNQMAARLNKYMLQLDQALFRIRNGTYGICVDTGKLIPKERLRAVPHTQHTIEAKRNRS